VSCVQAAALTATTDSATTSFLSIWDLPVRPVRAHLAYLQAFDDIYSVPGRKVPGNLLSHGRVCSVA
jgi:hypothetical protein